MKTTDINLPPKAYSYGPERAQIIIIKHTETFWFTLAQLGGELWLVFYWERLLASRNSPYYLSFFSLLIVLGIHCFANYRINYLKKDVCVTLRNMIFVFDQTKNQILVLLNENDGVGMPVFERNGFCCARRRENAIYLIGRPNAELLFFLERNVTKYKTPPMEYHEFLIKLISDDSNFADEIETLLVKPVTKSFLL